MKKYYIAVNRSTCAIHTLMGEPVGTASPPSVSPRPQALIGFPTAREAQEAFNIFLNAPIDEARRFFASLKQQSEVKIIWFDDPEEPQEATLWSCE